MRFVWKALLIFAIIGAGLLAVTSIAVSVDFDGVEWAAFGYYAGLSIIGFSTGVLVGWVASR